MTGIIPGNDMDTNGCIGSAGYTWCQSSQNCIRGWETPCIDNFKGCGDCLMKQRKGINIACPPQCDMVDIDYMPIPQHPMPPQPMPPQHIPEANVCSDVMCMMYCEAGHKLDERGCQMCECNEPIRIDECLLEQSSCDNYEYVCPKITEMTHCSDGGIEGYTTYQLSLTTKPNMNIENIYAIYGNTDAGGSTMHIPVAYHTEGVFNSNIGGVNPNLIDIYPDAAYDSWLTIGITDGDPDNLISTIGIDYNLWTETEPLDIGNGAVFLMDPEIVVSENNEYIIGQLTIMTNKIENVIINVQGKIVNSREPWSENNIVFILKSSGNIIANDIPSDCTLWYDGCNLCRVDNSVLGGCTRIMCFTEDVPECKTYTNGH